MAENTQTTKTSPVATNSGKVEQVPDLQVSASRIYGFVQMNKADYFEDHSLDYCLDEIISRGMAEITRQVKTAKKLATDRAAGKLLDEYKLTPNEAKMLIASLKAKAAEAEANAKPKS